MLTGRVAGGDKALAGYRVTLFANYLGRGLHWARLDSDVSNSAGHFRLSYQLRKTQFADSPLLFLQARRGKVLLASALGPAASVDGGSVTVNERTTVATGTAYARFVRGTRVDGNKYGMRNAFVIAVGAAEDPTDRAAGLVQGPALAGDRSGWLPRLDSNQQPSG